MPTVAVASMTFSVTSGPAGTSTVLTVAGITEGGSPIADGKTVVVAYVAPDGSVTTPLSGTTLGGSCALPWSAGTALGVYTFGPPVIDGETVAGVTAAFTLSTSSFCLIPELRF